MTVARMSSCDEEEIPQELNPPVFPQLWAKQFIWTFLKAAFILMLWWMKKKMTYHCNIFWITIDLSQPYWEIIFSDNSKHLMHLMRFQNPATKWKLNYSLVYDQYSLNIVYQDFQLYPFMTTPLLFSQKTPNYTINTFLAQRKQLQGMVFSARIFTWFYTHE